MFRRNRWGAAECAVEIGMKVSRALLLVATWSAAAYFLLLPLVQPRGRYGWGHYGGRDLLLGVVLLVIALVVSSVMRRGLLEPATALCATLIAAIAAWIVGANERRAMTSAIERDR